LTLNLLYQLSEILKERPFPINSKDELSAAFGEVLFFSNGHDLVPKDFIVQCASQNRSNFDDHWQVIASLLANSAQINFPVNAMRTLFQEISSLNFPILDMSQLQNGLGGIQLGEGVSLQQHLPDLTFPIPNSSELLYQLSSLSRSAPPTALPRVSVAPMGNIRPRIEPAAVSPARAEPPSKIMAMIDDLSQDLKAGRSQLPQRPLPKKSPVRSAGRVQPSAKPGPLTKRVKASLKDQFVHQMGLRIPTEAHQSVQPVPKIPIPSPAAVPQAPIPKPVTPVVGQSVTPIPKPATPGGAFDVATWIEQEIDNLNSLKSHLSNGGLEKAAASFSPADEETRRVLQELDRLLEHVPEEYVEEFVSSALYFVYEKVMKHYGIS